MINKDKKKDLKKKKIKKIIKIIKHITICSIATTTAAVAIKGQLLTVASRYKKERKKYYWGLKRDEGDYV